MQVVEHEISCDFLMYNSYRFLYCENLLNLYEFCRASSCPLIIFWIVNYLFFFSNSMYAFITSNPNCNYYFAVNISCTYCKYLLKTYLKQIFISYSKIYYLFLNFLKYLFMILTTESYIKCGKMLALNFK